LLFWFVFKPFLKIFLFKEIFKGCCLLFSYQGSFSVLSQATAFIVYHKLYRLSRTFLFFADRSSDSFNILPHRRDIVNNFFYFLFFRLRVFR
ncbi:hypothetical protein, partial [[Ruminococcus] torques]|uniref:hypothetical protein n=1 Tax=[Ruminococcus] torques TaxID=33039 RepID=UPI00242D3E99